ncbi:hypothetical protein V5H72_00355 [Helicobacter pylori]|uniref:hypothetical protein n=1 Tax=Helicobacter pylori TaxID=210 RepID=UPI0004656260|nr:hypothetical protein [Helicobacter pylori]
MKKLFLGFLVLPYLLGAECVNKIEKIFYNSKAKKEGVEVLMDTTSSLNKQGYKIVSMVESPFDKGILIVAYEKCLEFKKELNHE